MSKDDPLAYQAQLRSEQQKILKRLGFRLQHQAWWRLARERRLYVDIDINTDAQRIGLFAELIWLLYAVLYIEEIGGIPRVRLTSKTYSPEGDGLSDYVRHYFRPQWQPFCESSMWRLSARISSLAQLPSFVQRTTTMSLWRANDMISRYLFVSPDIEAEVERFVADRLGGSYIAVHWRGTDKCLEASTVNADQVVTAVRNVLCSMDCPPSCLFIATDQQDLLESLIDRVSLHLPGLKCVFRNDCKRSVDGTPIHLRHESAASERFDLGRNALIDALILSRSRALVRTASFLSAWSSIVHPTLPVFMLNEPIGSKCWFPDSEILFASRYHYRQLQSNSLGG